MALALAPSLVTARDLQQHTLPVLPSFANLVPHGVVQRGIVVSCHGPAAVSLAMGFVAGPVRDGAWVGVAGVPELGLAAAAELGVPLERMVAVVEPASEPFSRERWADVVAALIDGFDTVVLGGSLARLSAADARRLRARAQSRGAVLVAVDLPAFEGDIRLTAEHCDWSGLGAGYGVASQRWVRVECSGRRVPAPRRGQVCLP